MADLVVIVPSRGRPGNVERLVEAWEATTTWDSKLVVAVDADDPEVGAYKALPYWRNAGPGPAGRFRLRVGPRLRLVGTLNEQAALCAGGHRALGFMGDDHVPRTPGWDRLVLDALKEMGSGIVYGDDLLQGERLPTAAFMTADIPVELGWMAPPELTHLYVDNAWLELGRAIGRLRYLPDVVIEHMHPGAGKASWDAGYEEANAAEADAVDKAAFERWRAEGLPVAVELLWQRAVI